MTQTHPLSSWAATLSRGGLGLMRSRRRQDPTQLLTLYDREASAACRLVREALTVLDLDYRCLPVPLGGGRHLDPHGRVVEVPRLLDPNTNGDLLGANEIVPHLFRHYGGRTPLPIETWEAPARVATHLRRGRGQQVRPSTPPAGEIELYNTEASPYCRMVREVLCELELPYTVRSVAKGGLRDFLLPPQRRLAGLEGRHTTDRRAALHQRAGQTQIPYLVDNGAGRSLFESAAICDYLQQTYAA